MAHSIKNKDDGTLAEVDKSFRLLTRAVTSSETQHAVRTGYAWNINTGWISSIAANSALLYFKNNDEEDFIVDAIAVGVKDGSAVDVLSVYAVKNPTGGTLVSAATDCDMIENRNFGSGNSFDTNTLIYKATASAQTLTGGSDVGVFAQNDQGRLFANVDFLIPKTKSIGIRIETDGTFSGDVYAALIGHQVEIL